MDTKETQPTQAALRSALRAVRRTWSLDERVRRHQIALWRQRWLWEALTAGKKRQRVAL